MPASRWNSSILEMLNWLYEEHAGMEDVIAQPIVTRVVQNESPEAEQPVLVSPDDQIPGVLPVLPLRGLVVYPQTAVPLTIGQPRSIRLVDDVMARRRAPDRAGHRPRPGAGNPGAGGSVSRSARSRWSTACSAPPTAPSAWSSRGWCAAGWKSSSRKSPT